MLEPAVIFFLCNKIRDQRLLRGRRVGQQGVEAGDGRGVGRAGAVGDADEKVTGPVGQAGDQARQFVQQGGAIRHFAEAPGGAVGRLVGAVIVPGLHGLNNGQRVVRAFRARQRVEHGAVALEAPLRFIGRRGGIVILDDVAHN